MSINEFLRKYYLHDSLVDKVEHDKVNNKVLINIDLCNWLQNDYSKGDSEMIKGVLEFCNISNYYSEPANMIFDSDEIITVDIVENELIKFLLHGTDDIKIIMFKASEVNFINQKGWSF